MTVPHAEATGARAPDTEWARREPFRSLARGGADILAVVDRDSTVRWVSPWVTLLLGHAPEDLIGRRGFDFVHPDDRARVADRFVYP